MRLRLTAIALLGLLTLLLSLVAVGCAEELDEETYIQVMLDQTLLMFSESLDPETALEAAAEENNTSLKAVEAFREELEKDPDLHRAINDRINLLLDELILPSLIPGASGR